MYEKLSVQDLEKIVNTRGLVSPPGSTKRVLVEALEKDDSGSAKRRKVESAVLEQAKCPVCFELCTPPIMACVESHIICNKCLPQMKQKCPSCSKSLAAPIHLRLLENALTESGHLQKCTFEGCDKIFFHDDSKHQEVCVFRPLPCFLPTCEVKCKNADEMVTHLTTVHKFLVLPHAQATVKHVLFHANWYTAIAERYILSFGGGHYVLEATLQVIQGRKYADISLTTISRALIDTAYARLELGSDTTRSVSCSNLVRFSCLSRKKDGCPSEIRVMSPLVYCLFNAKYENNNTTEVHLAVTLPAKIA